MRRSLIALSVALSAPLSAGLARPVPTTPPPSGALVGALAKSQAPKWYAAVAWHQGAPNKSLRVYGPFRGKDGLNHAIASCMRHVSPQMRAEGWQCVATGMEGDGR